MNTSYDHWGNLEPTTIYLAKPGKRIIGAIPGIDYDSCRYEKNLNNTSVLEFTVWRDIDGEINPVYEYIEQHYELAMPGKGWFKINEEPEISSDGNVETKNVRAESLEIELQQYDVSNFHVNTADVMSKEMLAVDNTYDLEGFNMFRDQVLFYRDVTDLEELQKVFVGTSAADLQRYLYDHPDILQCWRIDFDYDLIDSDIQAAANEYRSEQDYARASGLEEYIGTVKKGDQQKKSRVINICSIYPVLLKHVHITVEMYDNPDDHSSYLNDMYEVIDKQLKRMKSLSLMHLILEGHGWTVGKIGTNRGHRTFSDYVYVNVDSSGDEYTKLCNSVGRFEIDSQDIYSLLTQEVSSYFECLFEFDTDNYQVNAYKIDDVGLDTNIYLSFHNIQNSVTRGSDKQIYTVFNIRGGNDLYPDEANFGESWIENIDYFLTTDHFSEDFIGGYNYWKQERERLRPDYMTASINRRLAQEEADEIYDRVPPDSADTHQYSTMSDNELEEEYNANLAILAGYEGYYVDEDGVFQPETIMKVVSPSDYSNYYMIHDQVLENIKIEQYNRQVTTPSDTRQFLDGWQYDFATYGDSYGVAELKTSMTTLQNSIKTLVEKGYDVYPEDGDIYKIAQYELYCKYRTALNQCTDAYNARLAEWNTAVAKVNQYLNEMNSIKDDVNIENGRFGFSVQDLWLLDKYRIYTDYTNENITTTASSSPQEWVQKAYELIQDAKEELSAESQPQWTFSTTQDNLLLMPEFEGWHKQLDVGNFVRVAMREDYQVKLRVTTIAFNPFLTEPTIDLTFSNMVQYAAKRNDFVSLLENGRSSSKNQISATINSISTKGSDINVDTAFILKLINNGTFSSYMNSYGTDVASGAISAVSGAIPGIIAATDISVDHIVGNSAEFRELFTQYLDADIVVAKTLAAADADIQSLSAQIIRVGTDSITEIADGRITTAEINVGQLVGDFGNFATLVANSMSADTIATKLFNAQQANIDALASRMITVENISAEMAQVDFMEAGSIFAGSAFINSLQGFTSTFLQSVAGQAYIQNAVINKLSVADLAAGDITLSENMRILSENGMMVMNGNVLQIGSQEDQSGNIIPQIQLGYASNEQPSLIFKDAEGNSGIVIGYPDNTGKPSISIYDTDGNILIDSGGIAESGGRVIADELIVNDMIRDSTLTKDKFSFNVMEEGDHVQITQIYNGDQLWGIEQTDFYQSTNSALDELSREIDETSSYQLYIETPNGVNARGGELTLVAHLFKNNVEVTSYYDDSCFIWRKVSSDSASDEIWNSRHSTGQKILAINGNDINISTNIECHFIYDTDTEPVDPTGMEIWGGGIY